MGTVALVCETGWNNSGDDLMLRGTIRALQELDPGGAITVITPNSPAVRDVVGTEATCVESSLITLSEAGGEGASRRKQFKAAERVTRAALGGSPPEPIRDSLQAIGDADLMLFAGGGYLNDRWPLTTLSSAFMAQAAAARGTPYAVFGHTIGPFEDSASRGWTRRVLEGAVRIAVREPRSAWEASTLTRDRPVDVTGDPALQLPEATADAADRTPRLAVNFRMVDPRDAELVTVVGDAVMMVANPLKAEVSFVEASLAPSYDDRYAHKRLDEHILASLPRGMTFSQTPGRLELPTASVVLAVSFHVCLLALARGTPVIGIATTPYYRHKLRGLFELFERPDWVWTPEATVHDLIPRALTAAGDTTTDRQRQIAADLAERQRRWLREVLEATG